MDLFVYFTFIKNRSAQVSACAITVKSCKYRIFLVFYINQKLKLLNTTRKRVNKKVDSHGYKNIH
jgi:hypothetical protein